MQALSAALACAAATCCTGASAWGPEGHHTVGALADKLIAGSNAAAQVRALLGGLSLQNAAVWADCAKGVDPAQDYAYTAAGRYPECKIFETPQLEAEMSDFVRRNDKNCHRKPSEDICHAQYHYSDAAIQRSRYALGTIGTRRDDIVAAVAAMTQVLQGHPAPAPFDIEGPREALLLLAHYAGDMHQPLHVGAIYLAPNGERVDPDSGTFDPATETRGANQIITIDAATKTRAANLHRVWDAVPAGQTVAHIDAAWLRLARKVPVTAGDPAGWPTTWATQTLGQARKAFGGLKFGPREAGVWTVSLPSSYAKTMALIPPPELAP
jgi:hypothetical protein